jgi:uncharacterized protein (DUF1778 family)
MPDRNDATAQARADRRWFLLDEDAGESFADLLERPPVLKPRLQALLQEEATDA